MTQAKKILICISLATLFLTIAAPGLPRNIVKPSASAAARFLEQASWGPTSTTVAHVQDVGFEAYIEEQFSTSPSTFTVPAPDANGNIPYGPLQEQFFFNAINGNDQLRQRVVLALNHIWVISGVKITDPTAMVNYLQVLQKDAFANYYDVMYDITLSPGMGHYLDMVNNDKPNLNLGQSANENYAREFMQLFTIGLNELDLGGSIIADGSGNPIPTYTQDTVEGFARAYTGWTYAPAPGAVSHTHNPANWTQPMVAWDTNHDTASKTLLNGTTLPPNQTAVADLQGALQNIFNHPNVGPFVCRQLIQHLVTSNPSPLYVARVAGVFNGDTGSPRGDLKAVIKAILLDPEARMGDNTVPPAGEGHLREPVLFISTLLRTMNATVDPTNGLPSWSNTLGQNIYFPPSVFNYFSPSYRISGTSINAPEFQLLSTSTAMLRADFINSLIYGKIPGVTVDLTPIIQESLNASSSLDSTKLLQVLSTTLMDGQMTADMEAAIKPAVDAATTAQAKAQAAAYLIASSWQYQVER